MAHKIKEIASAFSPMQIGYIADMIDPIDANTKFEWAVTSLNENPDMEGVPIERDEVVLGVITRSTLNRIARSAWRRFWLKDLDAYIIPVIDVIDGTAYINRILENALKQESYEDFWYVIQYMRSYLGIVSVKKILEYTNTLRSMDLRRAGEIQQYLLKKSFVKDKRFEVFLFNHMAHEIGGDFYRIYKPTKDQILVCCFDVAGKNYSAALATMTLGTCFSSFDLFQYSSSPDKMTSMINNLIREVNPPGVFVAAVLFYIDFTIKQIRIHNCGFSPVLLFIQQPDNKIGYKISNPNLPPLGIEDEYDYSDSLIIPITQNLRLCAFSDGLTDMVNTYGERYEEEQAINLIKRLHKVPHAQIHDIITREISDWVETASLADDITMVDIRFH